MKRYFLYIWFLFCTLLTAAQDSLHVTPYTVHLTPYTLNDSLSAFHFTPYTLHLTPYTLDDIILDIYNAATEISETDFEQLQSDLYALHESPIDLNNTSDEELTQLYFLSPRQIDDILSYADRHPFQSLYELRMIPSLEDYEIRDLLPFVKDPMDSKDLNNPSPLFPREVFAKAQHEIITRLDARNIENFEGTDPVYFHTRYRFDYQRKVVFGAQLRRPAGGLAADLQYGAYLQLRDITPHLHTLVAGNYQASFGQGLVLAPVFHAGKSMYVSSVGQTIEGLRYYSSVDGEGLHGVGATFRWEWGKSTRLDATALYSMKRANDSTWHHLVGANLSFRHQRLHVQLTALENIYTDSIRPYRNAAYNQHYFRGRNQAVLGASVRYNHGWFDAFAEVATNQKSEITNSKWGIGLIAGSRFYPANGVSLVALYRYYSPYFDNALGYAFSETSRLGDENGGYLGVDITRLARWRFSGYADVFRFSGPKYGIPDYPSIGYDALLEAQHIRQDWRIGLRGRAKRKGEQSTYSTRFTFDWQSGPWSLRTTANANLVNDKRQTTNDQLPLTYGLSLAQDLAYDFNCTPYTIHLPLKLRFRVQGFDARNWANRIYLYEHDVLYAWSIPAVYGLGGRFVFNLRWQIIPQLAMYFRLSETVYSKQWATAHGRPSTRTDIHLLFRAKL